MAASFDLNIIFCKPITEMDFFSRFLQRQHLRRVVGRETNRETRRLLTSVSFEDYPPSYSSVMATSNTLTNRNHSFHSSGASNSVEDISKKPFDQSTKVENRLPKQCKPCQQARASSDYIRRIKTLLQPLFAPNAKKPMKRLAFQVLKGLHLTRLVSALPKKAVFVSALIR